MPDAAGFTISDPPSEPDGRADEPANDDAPWPDPIDEAAYHGLAGDVVREIGPHTEAHPVALLIQFLVFFGNAIGIGPYYQVEADRHYTNLYVVIVGETAKARKGTSAGRVCSIFRIADPEWEAYHIHSGMTSGEGLIFHVRDPRKERVREGKGAEVRYVEQEVDPGVGDKRLMILEAEFAQALRVMERPGNTLSGVVRDGWDHRDLQTLAKNSPAHATAPHISIAGHITREELRRSLNEVEIANGFANRFAFACVRRARVLPHGGNLPEKTLENLGERTRRAIEYAREVGRVILTEEAKGDWEQVYPALSEGQPGLHGAILARAEAQVIRLALIYALLDLKTEIGREHLKAALALWEYVEGSARHIFGDALGDPVADTILRALRQRGNTGMTRTEIRDLFGRHRSAGQIDRALALLVAQGKAGKREGPDTGGRSAEIWTATRGAR